MKLDNENGSVLIEFIIVLPIFLTLIFVSIMIGMIIYTKTLIVTAVGNGAHQGSYIGNSSEYTEQEKIDKIKNDVEAVILNAPMNNGYDLDISFDNEYVVIEVNYKFNVNFPIVNMFFDDGNYVITEKSRSYIQPELETWED